ncbi:MAG: DUF5674 family protein [Caldilineaceae bacterium]
MIIHIIRTRATSQQVAEMQQTLQTYIKLAIDVERKILAGGGEMHADCEDALLEDGSRQEDIWGADWSPLKQQVTYESLINIRPRQNNRSMEIQDATIRQCVDEIVFALLGGV